MWPTPGGVRSKHLEMIRVPHNTGDMRTTRRDLTCAMRYLICRTLAVQTLPRNGTRGMLLNTEPSSEAWWNKNCHTLAVKTLPDCLRVLFRRSPFTVHPRARGGSGGEQRGRDERRQKGGRETWERGGTGKETQHCCTAQWREY